MKTFFDIPENVPNTPLLDKISDPSELRKLSKKELLVLADELREFLIYSVSKAEGILEQDLSDRNNFSASLYF